MMMTRKHVFKKITNVEYGKGDKPGQGWGTDEPKECDGRHSWVQSGIDTVNSVGDVYRHERCNNYGCTETRSYRVSSSR
jgi:hypothetical protein